MPSIAIPLSLRGQLLSGSRFEPSRLFAANEPGIWYQPSDLTTMFQDRAGTTLVTAPGQSVGLRLDKSKGLVLGSELVTNGDFSSGATNWITNTGWVIAGGVASYTAGTASGLFQSKALSAATRYLVTFTKTGTGSVSIRLGTGGVTQATFTSEGNLSAIVQPDGTGFVGFFGNNSGNFTIDNISVKELPGNHAVSNSDAARGIYGIEPLGGRRNLLTYTEQFSNAIWTKAGAGTGVAPVVNIDAALAPDGTMTADRIDFNRGAGNTLSDRSILSQALATSDNVAMAGSIYLKAATAGDIGKTIAVRTAATSAYTEVTLTADWVRFSSSSTTTARTMEIESRGTFSASNVVSVLIWGAQLETGSTATAYQKVVSQYEVTEAGKPTLHYVQYDGVDDGYVTPTITPGTDKVQVFAGVRKLSDAAAGVLVESSANKNDSAGTIIITAPELTGSSGNFAFNARGTVNAAFPPSSGTMLAPTTRVITGLGDIPADSRTLRVNGVQVSTSVENLGTGNFLAYPLYIGRRGGTSLPFNGRDYGLIVRFGSNLSAETIAATEAWMNGRTGAY